MRTPTGRWNCRLTVAVLIAACSRSGAPGGDWSSVALEDTIESSVMNVNSPAKTHRVKVRDYKKHKGTTYRIFVDSWRPGHAEEKLFTTKDFKDAAPAYVDVVSREGALGLEYVTAVKIPVGGR